MRVFVYGSLRRNGFLNTQHFADDHFVRVAKTDHGFSLHDITGGAFPAMVSTNQPYQVVGEVYDVDDKMIAHLDRVEGHPNFYCRTEILLEDGESVFAYLLDQHREAYCSDNNLVVDGDWYPFILKAIENKNKETEKWFI